MGARAGKGGVCRGSCQGLGMGLGDCTPQVGAPLGTRRVVFRSFPCGPRCYPCPGGGGGGHGIAGLGCLLIRWDSVSLCLRSKEQVTL